LAYFYYTVCYLLVSKYILRRLLCMYIKLTVGIRDIEGNNYYNNYSKGKNFITFSKTHDRCLIILVLYYKMITPYGWFHRNRKQMRFLVHSNSVLFCYLRRWTIIVNIRNVHITSNISRFKPIIFFNVKTLIIEGFLNKFVLKYDIIIQRYSRYHKTYKSR